jgi:hypothetical protein
MASEEELFANIDALLAEEPRCRPRPNALGCVRPPASRRPASRSRLTSRFHEAGCPAGGQESRKCL